MLPIDNIFQVNMPKFKTDPQRRPQAGSAPYSGNRSVARAVGIAAMFLVVVAGLALTGKLPFAVLALYFIASAIAFGAYSWDKSAAQKDQRRIAESTLHLLDLFCGWPGALIARQVLRHKTQKQSFILTFWGTVILNCSALVWLLTPQGQQFLESLLREIG